MWYFECAASPHLFSTEGKVLSGGKGENERSTAGRGSPPRTGEFRGYCFAYFDSVDNATVAKNSLVGLTIGDQILDVKYSNKTVTEAFAPPIPVME